VDTSEAVALIEGAVPRGTKTWADVGSGDGTFTRALLELLGHDARIYAIDRDARALTLLRQWATRDGVDVLPVEADFTKPLDLPQLLDGLLLANALHFVRDAESVLARLASHVRPGGRVVLVEYDRRRGSRWVPYPISPGRLPTLAESAGLSTPRITATRPSMYGGSLYVAAADRIGPG
jgi:SAM-dependent methyltransferase